MAHFNSISPSALMRLIGTPAAPRLIDLSLEPDVTDDPFVIPTAIPWPHKDVNSLSQDTDFTRKTVFICQKGRKLSHGGAAVLRTHGLQGQVLEGGNLAWRAAGLPRIPLVVLPASCPGSLWVTRQRPKIDRIACPWLIRRFIDPQARFLFVPASDVIDVADKFGAIPFDVAGVRWSHKDDNCTFDALIEGFGLRTPPLDKMANVIRGADTNAHDLAPECAGLLALSVGLSRAYADDLAQLEAGMTLYDALYRWARDGAGETHDSQETRA